MLNGKELGRAIEKAIKAKVASGKFDSAARVMVDLAEHFDIRVPSVYDWIKKGSIKKDKLPRIWAYFSDVAGPEHWGLDKWPIPGEIPSDAKKLRSDAMVLDADERRLVLDLRSLHDRSPEVWKVTLDRWHREIRESQASIGKHQGRAGGNRGSASPQKTRMKASRS